MSTITQAFVSVVAFPRSHDQPFLMLGRPTLLFSNRFKSPTCGWNQIRLHNLTTARSLRKSPISTYAKLGLSLASFLGLITVRYPWSQLNLDESPAVRDDSRESRRHSTNLYVRHPLTDVQTLQQTVFPGDHTGITRYDTVRVVDSTSDRVTDFAVGVLPVPSGYWSIFALLNADGPGPVDRGPVSWVRRSIIPAIAGSLADVHNSTRPPPDTHIDDALRQTLARLDIDISAQTGAAWTRQASPTSTLVAFFDSESRVLRIANAGAGRAFLGRRVGNGHHECRELAGSGTARYLLDRDAQSRARDVEELVGGSVFPSRGSLDAASVEVESVEVRDGDFLVLGSLGAWSGLAGDEAVQAVSGWIREQEEEPSASGRPTRGGHWPHDPFLDFPWKGIHGLGLDWVRTMIPDLIREFDTMFVGARENVASRVLRATNPERRAECSPYDQDCHPSELLSRPIPNSG
ncbi:hypothetical protein BC827DRAFT_1204563 [Russula dissimulans]|nr:hypothetical protein BC827DRAFT_1204563 [Russula dissimulans]